MKIIKCDCGYVVKGETDEELVSAAQEHAKTVHQVDITAEQALSMAELA